MPDNASSGVGWKSRVGKGPAHGQHGRHVVARCPPPRSHEPPPLPGTIFATWQASRGELRAETSCDEIRSISPNGRSKLASWIPSALHVHISREVMVLDAMVHDEGAWPLQTELSSERTSAPNGPLPRSAAPVPQPQRRRHPRTLVPPAASTPV